MSELVASLWTPEYRMTPDKTLAWKVIDDQLIYIRAISDELLSKNKKVSYLGSKLKVGEAYVLEDTKEKFLVFSGNDPLVDRELSFDTSWLPEDARYIGDVAADDYLSIMRVPFNETIMDYVPIVWNLGDEKAECDDYFYSVCNIDLLEFKYPPIELGSSSKPRYVSFGITYSDGTSMCFCYDRHHSVRSARLDNASANFPITAYYESLRNGAAAEVAKVNTSNLVEGKVDDQSTAETLVRSMSEKDLLGAAALAGSAPK